MCSDRALWTHALAVCCLLIPSGARAEPGPPPEIVGGASPESVAEDAPAPAAPVAAQPVPNAPTENARTRRAREVIGRARARFDQGDYGAALVDFRKAHELLEGDPRQPAVLNNIAVCYERMFRYHLALEYYKRYLREGAQDEADRAEVEQVVRGLEGLLGQLHLTSNVPARVWVGQTIKTQAPGDVWVPAGPHVLEVSASGYETQRREVQVAPRSEQSQHFELAPLPQYEGISSVYFWSGLGVTGAALVTGAAFGIRALREDARLSERDDVWEADKDRIDRLQLGADVSFGVAALFGVSTLVLYFLTDWSGERPVPDASRARRKDERRFSWSPGVSRSGASLTLRGSLR